MLERFLTIALTALVLAGCARTPSVLMLERHGNILPFEQLLAVARERYPDGIVLNVKIYPKPRVRYFPGPYYYEIELTDNINRRILRIDAHDARILEVMTCGVERRCWRR